MKEDSTELDLDSKQTITALGEVEYVDEERGFVRIRDSVLGIACDPWGTDDNFDVYFSMSKGFWVDE